MSHCLVLYSLGYNHHLFLPISPQNLRVPDLGSMEDKYILAGEEML